MSATNAMNAMNGATVTHRLIGSLEEMRLLAEELAARVGPRYLLLLNGPMGAGKTQFTRFFVEALGSQETSSPSFALHHSYDTPLAQVEHMDLFRLESQDDLESIGFWDFFLEREKIVMVEWANRLTELGLDLAWPRTWRRWQLDFAVPSEGGQTRVVTLTEFAPGG